ncbi:MAG TPA: DNA primase, partial [Acidimicrobiales bacterium]|nr:DNA primase [Acidimicrobiales bacterium]
MAIPDEEVALVRQATDMVALVSEYLALRKAGRRWVGICPFHQEKTPSFNVNAEDGLFHCFGCHASGDAITFLREVEHLDFVEAVERLASRAHITLHETSNPADAARRKKRDDLLEVVQAAVDFYHQSLQNSDAAQHARDYLAERGYGASTIAMFRLGWSPDDWDVVAKELKFDNKLLVEAGIGFVNKRGRFQDAMRGRLIFPIFDSAGRSVAMGGRIIPGHAPSGDTDAPKYKNSPETSIYSKRRTLYGLNWAKAEVASTNQIVVCEGYTDVIGCHLAGVPNVVATCGTALAEEHFAIL